MKSIDIASIDYEFSREIARDVYIRLKELNLDVMFVDPYESTFSQIIQVAKVYANELGVSRQSIIFLEAARESQVQRDVFEGIKNNDTIVINPLSFILYLISNAKIRKDVNKVLTKNIAKKLSLIPSYIFVLKLNIDEIKKTRKKMMNNSKRITDNMKGQGLKARQTMMIKSLDRINKTYKTKPCIIDVVDSSNKESIVNGIVKFILEDNTWQNAFRLK